MLFDNRSQMKTEGFSGFVPVQELQKSKCSEVPKTPGVYFILREGDTPHFRKESIGGHFKGKNPTVGQQELVQNWVEGSEVVYIGKAGSLTGSATLQSRLRQYMRFGKGDPVSHWGGRYIWQLENSAELNVAWKPTGDEDPRTVEKELIGTFAEECGQRPFANLIG